MPPAPIACPPPPLSPAAAAAAAAAAAETAGSHMTSGRPRAGASSHPTDAEQAPSWRPMRQNHDGSQYGSGEDEESPLAWGWSGWPSGSGAGWVGYAVGSGAGC